ncbi:MAG: tetratricopeptide repeat protein [Pseudomonadota bacterium]|nr:tetratricopeptide repeat protein [Pseudomonadota bacterium]
MDDLLSEKEQIQYIREWWQENRLYIFVVGFLLIGGIAGNNFWKSSILNHQVSASSLYESLATEISENDIEGGEAIAQRIYAEYQDTIYADKAKLAMAYFYMSQSRDEDAANVLRDLISTPNNNELQLLGNLRLAKILLYQGKNQDVLELLENNVGHAYEAKYSELLGDAYFALENYSKAEFAYMNAIKDSGSSQMIDASLIQMKLNDLPEIFLPDEAASINKEEPQ